MSAADVWQCARVLNKCVCVCMGNNLSFPYAGVSNYHPQLSAAASFLGESSRACRVRREHRQSRTCHEEGHNRATTVLRPLNPALYPPPLLLLPASPENADLFAGRSRESPRQRDRLFLLFVNSSRLAVYTDTLLSAESRHAFHQPSKPTQPTQLMSRYEIGWREHEVDDKRSRLTARYTRHLRRGRGRMWKKQSFYSFTLCYCDHFFLLTRILIALINFINSKISHTCKSQQNTIKIQKMPLHIA